jgi:hypothetical protein
MYRTYHIFTVRADMPRFVAASASPPEEGDTERSSVVLSSSDRRASPCPYISSFAGPIDPHCESYAISGRKTGESLVTADGRVGNDVS